MMSDALQHILTALVAMIAGIAGAGLGTSQLATRLIRRRAQRRALETSHLLAALRMALAALESRLNELSAGDTHASLSGLETARRLLSDASDELSECLAVFSRWERATPALPEGLIPLLKALARDHLLAWRRHERALKQIDQRIIALQKQLGRIRRAIEQARRQTDEQHVAPAEQTNERAPQSPDDADCVAAAQDDFPARILIETAEHMRPEAGLIEHAASLQEWPAGAAASVATTQAAPAAEARTLPPDTEAHRAAHHRSRLMAALDSPEILERGRWVQPALAIQSAVSAYAPDNWPARDSVMSLKSDIAMLAGIEAELEPVIGGQPIPESQVALWLSRVGAYIRERRALHARLTRIETELASLQSIERRSISLVSDTLNALARLPADTTEAGTDSQSRSAWDDLMRLWAEGEKLAAALERRHAGRVADKALAAEDWAGRCADSAWQLLMALEAECRALWENLRRQVARVTRLAPLNLEPSMMIASRLAETPLRLPDDAGDQQAESSDHGALETIEARVERIARTVALHTRLSHALREFDRQVVSPIAERPEQILAQRQAASETWEKLEAVRARARDLLPIPIACPEIDQIERAFAAAENEWIELGRSGRTVSAAIARLDSLAEQYSAVCAQGGELRARLEGQFTQLWPAWERLSRWRRRLMRYREQHISDRQLVAAINARLAEMDRELNRLRERSATTPPPPDQARQEIERILRESYRDVVVNRSGRTDTMPAQTIGPVEL